MVKENLVHFLANKVLSGNQHVVLNVYGSAGTGKSMFAGGLIVGLANYMGDRLHRDPRTLFNFSGNLACINLDRVQAVMEDPKEYNILWLDDIGVALNSRKFYKIENMDFNDILQTFRPNKNIVIVTTQQQSLIDAVIRKLAHFHVEMTHKLFETHHIPMTACKFKQVDYKHTEDKTYYPFLQDDNGRYVYHLCPKCPDEFLIEYDRIRADEFKRMLQMKRDAKNADKEKDTPSMKQRILELKRDWHANVDNCQIKYPSKRGIPKEYWITNGINPDTARKTS